MPIGARHTSHRRAVLQAPVLQWVLPMRAYHCLLPGLVLVACQDPGGEPFELVEDAPLEDMVLMAPEQGEPESIAIAQASTQWVYINFEGPLIESCTGFCSDAPNNRSWALGEVWGTSSVDFSPYGNASVRAGIEADLRSAFADYNVDFTTVRPAAGPYTMLVISTTAGPHKGVAPLNCNNSNLSDIAFVYDIANLSPRWIAQAGAHELGHSFGLSHVLSSADYMQWASAGHDFTVSGYDSAHASGKCFDGSTQDAPSMLQHALGVAAFDGVFYDDDGNTHEAAIEAIFAAGITVGCGNDGLRPLYCPSALVTRAQMAAFLTRGLNLPVSTSDHFDDDNGSWYEGVANRMADAGVTVGCGDRKYCGDQPVTRGQMAVFLTRALGLPPTTQDYFDDDDGSFYESSANRMSEAGITFGCGPRKYCGDAVLPRDQMASFLARAFDL